MNSPMSLPDGCMIFDRIVLATVGVPGVYGLRESLEPERRLP